MPVKSLRCLGSLKNLKDSIFTSLDFLFSNLGFVSNFTRDGNSRVASLDNDVFEALALVKVPIIRLLDFFLLFGCFVNFHI